MFNFFWFILMVLVLLATFTVGSSSYSAFPNPDPDFTPDLAPNLTLDHSFTPYQFPVNDDVNDNRDIEIFNHRCPFVLRMNYELDFFKAECEEVYMNKKSIFIPTGCRFVFKLEGKHKGRIINHFCPTLLILPHGRTKQPLWEGTAGLSLH